MAKDKDVLLEVEDPDDPDAKATADAAARRLLAKYPLLRPPVIHGLLHVGETMNVIAPPKVDKS